MVPYEMWDLVIFTLFHIYATDAKHQWHSQQLKRLLLPPFDIIRIANI
jgi:hypothetical protein